MKNENQFSGLWAVILGGSSGFGFATLEKLAFHGMSITVLYRETALVEKGLRERFAATASKYGVSILPYNINALDETGRKSFIEQFTTAVGKKACVKLLLHSIARGNLKPLVTNETIVGLAEEGLTVEILSAEDIHQTVYAMSTSMLEWARFLLKENLFSKNAGIIGLTSEGAHKYWENYAAVSVAKSSLESLTTYMAVELGKFGLRTNLIQAGITETPSLKKIPGSERLIELAGKRNPMGRITMPEDVANVIYLLCRDEAYWINGSVIHVDGGEHCR